MDIGIWMSRTVLREKLKLKSERNPEAAWNLRRWPQGFGEGENRLFVALDGMWRGYFKLSPDALYNPDDEAVPYTILFDTRTWTPIPSTPVKRFRGFTYQVPQLATASDMAAAPAATSTHPGGSPVVRPGGATDRSKRSRPPRTNRNPSTDSRTPTRDQPRNFN